MLNNKYSVILTLCNRIKENKIVTLKELRLLPYVQYLLVNQAAVDPRKISEEERHILQKWRDEGKLIFSCSESCACTKEFWDWMNAILYEGYVLES